MVLLVFDCVKNLPAILIVSKTLYPRQLARSVTVGVLYFKERIWDNLQEKSRFYVHSGLQRPREAAFQHVCHFQKLALTVFLKLAWKRPPSTEYSEMHKLFHIEAWLRPLSLDRSSRKDFRIFDDI